MKDTFCEQLIKRKTSSKQTFLKYAAIAFSFGIVVFVFLHSRGSIGLTLAAAVALGFANYYLAMFTSKEYEYTFTSGELDIDCIYSKSSRRRKLTCDVKEAFVLAHSQSREAAGEVANAQMTLDFGSGEISDKTWYLVISHESKRTKVILEPNDEMLAALKAAIRPFKVKTK